MKRRIAAALMIGGLTLAAAVGLAPRETAPVPHVPATADDFFTIDKAHSVLLYHLRHFGVSNFYGRVNMPTGSFLIDDADLVGSYLEVSCELKNMDTGNDGRDRFITGADFFSAREYPTASFKSTSIRKIGEGTYEADGAFTMHGITNDVTVRIEQFTRKLTERFGLRCGFEAHVTLSRSEFGMPKFVEEGTLGDDVTIIASIEGVQLPDE